jgi:FAD/FMN-containing dehydrogenase
MRGRSRTVVSMALLSILRRAAEAAAGVASAGPGVVLYRAVAVLYSLGSSR